jgi:hypothetical protein
MRRPRHVALDRRLLHPSHPRPQALAPWSVAGWLTTSHSPSSFGEAVADLDLHRQHQDERRCARVLLFCRLAPAALT